MMEISPIQSRNASPPKIEVKNSEGSTKPSDGRAESFPNSS